MVSNCYCFVVVIVQFHWKKQNGNLWSTTRSCLGGNLALGMVLKSPNQSFWCNLIALNLKYILCINQVSPILSLCHVDTLIRDLNRLHTRCFFHPPLGVYSVYGDGCVQSSASAHSDHGVGWLLLSYSNWGWWTSVLSTFESHLAGWRHEAILSRSKPGS